VYLKARNKLWSGVVLGCVAALVTASLLWRQSFRLASISDIIQCLLLMSGTLSFLVRAHSAKGRMRLFWSFMTLGLALWLSYQFLWTYFEVFLRTDVPDIFSGDIILFVHIVPMIAALALRPHLPRDQYAARLGRLDFAMLFVWWVYLYVLLVMAWQYATPDPARYNDNLNAVYLAEKLFFLVALAACWVQSAGRWRIFYANFFVANLLYAASSYIANWALSRKDYYSGSLYDIPLVTSMAWMTLIALWHPAEEPDRLNTSSSTTYGVWVARCGMIAAFSLPMFGAWALFATSLPPQVRTFRIVLTLAAALVMGVMVFTRQRFLDRELNRLLANSRESFENLKRLQAQILQSEKMASIGQLVAGAAHELNNPITAMLGYSDLLLGTELAPGQQILAHQISQQVRKTRSLVASLLSFARRAPAPKSPVDLNTLILTAIRLKQPQWQSLQIQVSTDLDPQLPKVIGDPQQLLQVCLEILSNSLNFVRQNGGGKLSLVTRAVANSCLLTAGESLAWDDGRDTRTTAPAANPAESPDLTVCRSIVKEHLGKIYSQRCQDGTSSVCLELPGTDLPSEKSSSSRVPLLKPSQPFA
jgi:signal transduction histidine kinase